jgi:hypothetical protein
MVRQHTSRSRLGDPRARAERPGNSSGAASALAQREEAAIRTGANPAEESAMTFDGGRRVIRSREVFHAFDAA